MGVSGYIREYLGAINSAGKTSGYAGEGGIQMLKRGIQIYWRHSDTRKRYPDMLQQKLENNDETTTKTWKNYFNPWDNAWKSTQETLRWFTDGLKSNRWKRTRSLLKTRKHEIGITRSIRMLEEASGCKTWLFGYLDEASRCFRLPDPETSTNRTLLETKINQSILHHSKKSWENKSQSIRINTRMK